MFYLRASSSIRSTLSRIELFFVLLRIFFFFFFHPFLADGVGGSSDVGEVRDTAAFSPTAQSSLKRPGPEYLVCSRSTGGSADFTFHYLMALRFDSLLPVSVKAELNVNQGPGREEHECKQIEPRAAQVGGTLSTERKGKERKGKERKGRSRQCRVSPARRLRAHHAPLGLRRHQIYMETA